MKRVSLCLLSLLLCLSLLMACSAPAVEAAPVEETRAPAAPPAEAAAPAEPTAQPPVASDAKRDGTEKNAQYLNSRYEIVFNEDVVRSESLNSALEKLGLEPVLSGQGAASVKDLLLSAIAAAEMTEFTLTYSEEKAAERLNAYGVTADAEAIAVELASALDCGLIDVSEATALAGADAATKDDAINLFARAIELSGRGRNFIGYSDDPDIARRIYNAWSNIPRYDEPELRELGLQGLLTGITTGFLLMYEGFDAHFIPELSMAYGQDSIAHAAQVLALLNREDMVVKVQLVPKISVYEYMLEWGPIPEPTPTYEVKTVEGRYFVHVFEYDMQMEFASREEMLRFNSIILEYAKKSGDNEEAVGLIRDSWWQPVYTTAKANEMPEGDDEYRLIAQAIVSNGSGYYTRSGILVDDMERVAEGLNALNPNCTCTTHEEWSNAAFYRYLTGEDYQ